MVPVYVALMSNLYNINGQNILFDAMQNAINLLPNSITVFAGQLLATWRTRIVDQTTDFRHDSTVGFAGNVFYLFNGGTFQANAIFFHAALDP